MSKTRTCVHCLESWELNPEYVTFHVCKGKPTDFIVGEVIDDDLLELEVPC